MIIDIKPMNVVKNLSVQLKLKGARNDKHKDGQRKPVHESSEEGLDNKINASVGKQGRVLVED